MCKYKNRGKLWGLIVIASLLISIFITGAISVCAATANAVTITAPTISEVKVDLPQENNAASPNSELLPVLLRAPPGVLPGSVYVLIDGRVVTEMPLITDASNTAAIQDKNMPTSSTSVEVTAQFTVIPSRIVVVDSSDEVIEIWNNACPEDSFYCLKVKEQDSHGPEHSLTPQILERYNSLLNEIGWLEQGKLFPSCKM